MTEQDIIQGLIAHDSNITRRFFFEKCRPLFSSIMAEVFSYSVDYDEFVSELYVYLMENDAARLRQFNYRSSIYLWLKVTATRFFIRKRDLLIDDTSKESPYNNNLPENRTDDSEARTDLRRLLSQLGNRRYALVIERLVIGDTPAEDVANELGVTTANLYNIKKRAIDALMRLATKDINHYGKTRH